MGETFRSFGLFVTEGGPRKDEAGVLREQSQVPPGKHLYARLCKNRGSVKKKGPEMNTEKAFEGRVLPAGCGGGSAEGDQREKKG